MENAKKITMATLKSFIRKEKGSLFVSVDSHFDGMVDCVMPNKDAGFTLATEDTESNEYFLKRTLGINGVWVVGESRDRIYPYDKDGYVGYHVYNACGSFTLAVKV